MSGRDESKGRRGSASRLRRRVPVGLLVLAMGLAGIGVVQAYEAHRSHRATAEALLHDYGIFAARGFLQSWSGLLESSLTLTLANARGAALRQSTTRQCLDTLLLLDDADYAASCSCGKAVRLVADDAWAFHVTLGGGPEERLLGGRVPDEAEAQAVLDSLTRFVRSQAPPPNAALRWVQSLDGGARLYALAAVPAFSGDTVLYGVEADPDRLRTTLELALDDERLLPPALTRGRTNRELLSVRLLLPDGREHWRSAAEGMGPGLEGAQPVDDPLGGGVIRASVLPEAAGTLVIGGLPGDRIPLLLLVFGLSGALALLAILQLRKEEAFARQRHDFVAGVSHELRTPLAQIRLFVETLRLGRTRTEEEREWALGNIDRETLRLVRLVENILHFHRAERGAVRALELEPADLGEEVRSVVEAFTPLLRPHEAEIRVEIPRGLVAEIHRDAFHQVLLNFLDNAVKYGPRGQTVRLTGSADDDSVRIAVEDEGPGVPEDEREEVWASFRRGGDTVGSVTTGSGIGLSVVRELVRAHGGRAWIEDGPRGARFVVELPRHRGPTAERIAPDQARDADRPGSVGVA